MENTIRQPDTIRSSNIELLKILAIFLIIISHWAQTLMEAQIGGETANFAINLAASTTDIKQLFLSFCRYFGSFGNIFFFICSAWFLVDSKMNKKQKVLNMILDVWLVSVLFLFATACDNNVVFNREIILRCLLPTTFNNNWYITAYIIFYLIYPALNKMIEQWSQKTHLSVVLITLFIYCVWCPLFREWGATLYMNKVLMWVVIYFVIAYIKRYLTEFSESTKANVILFVISFLCLIGSIFVTNYLGLKYWFFDNKVLNHYGKENLFILTMGISLLNLFRKLKIQSTFVNAVSRLTLFIYIIHENILVRTYYRPIVLSRIYETFGFSHIILWIFGLSIVTFIISTIVAFLYTRTLQKLTRCSSNKIYPFLAGKYNKFLTKVLAVK